MKKIGILSYPKIEDGRGRFLQAYALYTAISELGYDVEIINYRPQFFTYKPSIKNVIKNILKDKSEIKSYFHVARSRINGIFFKKQMIISENKYKMFIKKRIPYDLDNIVSKEKLNDLGKKYDALVCGSDQIWNPYFSCGKDDAYFLQFVKPNKRIAYAASIGTIQIPPKTLDGLAELIGQIPYCSMREKTSANYLNQKYSLEIMRVCDPTLLMPYDWWIELASCPRYKNKYILLFLFDNNPFPRKKAKEIAKKKNLDIIIISSDARDIPHSAIDTRSLGPEEFVSLFYHAEMVLTQSFHGTVLSIVFRKSFYVFDRSEAGQVSGLLLRLEDMLEQYGLSNRIVKNETDFNITNIDYSAIENAIQQHKDCSIAFLKNSLEAATMSKEIEQ